MTRLALALIVGFLIGHFVLPAPTGCTREAAMCALLASGGY